MQIFMLQNFSRGMSPRDFLWVAIEMGVWYVLIKWILIWMIFSTGY